MVTMQTLAEKFFTTREQEEITRTVQRVEQQTSGESVPMVVSASHTYPEAELTGATVLALPLALIAALVTRALFWWQGELLWLFLALLPLFFVGARLLMRHPVLLRLFISSERAAAEVERTAFTHFYAAGLQATRDATGVLIYISVLEHRVWILGDRGINQQLPPHTWEQAVSRLTAGIREKRQGAALCATIEEIGDLLRTHFPLKQDDRNELSDLIIGEKGAHGGHGLIVK
jgi:putative membrane protein